MKSWETMAGQDEFAFGRDDLFRNSFENLEELTLISTEYMGGSKGGIYKDERI